MQCSYDSYENNLRLYDNFYPLGNIELVVIHDFLNLCALLVIPWLWLWHFHAWKKHYEKIVFIVICSMQLKKYLTQLEYN
jgi:hypothetical protein